ncbi:hypothetical protein GOQ27_02115 [Clostridium sp. D2Q-11]|uniref:Spore coat protein GerQ n=1 Tax=Anaeromonas frigoriresistens TaxID=2683708 RepID=A0A942UTN8_9FIRM|nr:hypothetical protein [Anaeromonas frigoriresistens]MBS4537235.1 hypothetical protein [Anaeromonas frigoriresistens]
MYPNNYNLPMPTRNMQNNMPYYGYPMPNNPNMPNQERPDMPMPDRGAPEAPPVMRDTEYLQGYLNTLIGEFVRIDFLIGTNTFIDKAGTLMEVGIDYVVLLEQETDDYIVGDLYSIKFVKVLR